jgi:spore maturation protein CgeB
LHPDCLGRLDKLERSKERFEIAMAVNPKILLVGNWMWPWYEKACADALDALGCRVVPFEYMSEFKTFENRSVEPVYRSQLARLQNRLLIGPALSRINRSMKTAALKVKPDIIWFYNCTHIFASAVAELKQLMPKVLLVQFANDNPFHSKIRPDYWRHFKGSIPLFHLHFVYRKSNVPEFRATGAENVHLLRSYFIPEMDFPESSLPENRFVSDVVFAGHFEADHRLDALSDLAFAGHKLNLFGGGWEGTYRSLPREHPLYRNFPVKPAVGCDYRKAICGTKIALCFLSKINKDTYTRRNFQIPAMKTFMLSEYTEDLASLFEEGVDAEFFRSREELLDKVKFYIAHEELRQKIAENGYRRVIRDGHDVNSRMRYFLSIVTAAVLQQW